MISLFDQWLRYYQNFRTESLERELNFFVNQDSNHSGGSHHEPRKQALKKLITSRMLNNTKNC